MKRESGLRRTTLLTGALVAAGVAGTVAVGVAAHASDSAQTGTTSDSSSTTTTGDSSSSSDSPTLSGGSDGGGQATSGGS